MRADAAQLSITSMPKGQAQALQIISGQISKLNTGNVMQAVVQKSGETGSFKVLLQGESFTVKGLPSSVIGKEVSFIAQQLGSKGKNSIVLAWLGATTGKSENSSEGKTANPLLQQTARKAQQSTLLSALPADIKTGKAIAARIDSIQPGRMTITLLQGHGKQIDPSGTAKQQIITTPTMGLKAGQQVSINITEQIAAGKNIVEITPGKHVQNTPGKLNMAVGDSTLAMVQKRLSNGNVQINIKGSRVETTAPTQVKAGDALEIKLVKAPGEFQVIQVHKDVSQKALSLVRQNMPSSNAPIAQSLSSIQNSVANIANTELPAIKALALPQLDMLLKSTESSRDYPINGERLAQLIRDSGSSLEAKLQTTFSKDAPSPSAQQDLKAVLLQLSGEQNTSRVHNSEALRQITEMAQQGSNRIELGQALNVLANLQGEPIRLEFPMLVGQQLINVQMAVQQHESQTGQESDSDTSEQSFSVLFALELSGLGPMRVDANISDTTVHARIYSEDSSSSHFIQEHIGILEERLHNLGFEKVYLMSSANNPEVEKQQQFNELTTMRPTSFSLLDLLV